MSRQGLHIVHVVNSLGVGGTENGVVNLVNGLADRFRHTVVTLTPTITLAARLPAGTPVHTLDKRPGVDPRTIGRLAALLRRLRPDIVHSRNWATFGAVVAARLAGVRTVVHGEHGRDAGDPDGLHPRRRWRRRLAPLVSRFVTVSDDLRRWLVEHVGVPTAKVTRIYNGVDTSRFFPADTPWGRPFGLDLHEPVVGTVGRLDPVKDHAGLIQAFGRLAGDHPGARLLIVGDGPCRRELETLAASLTPGRVTFAGERGDVPELLRLMDVFALASLGEGISNTILEAMATGLPVVTTRVGGNPELVE
ncbi:MAG TPA: glycosyltransferase, partial [Candidatus Binatia bacterium]|nr:glycosyltransferase [Candidatus Binatia bacterium]